VNVYRNIHSLNIGNDSQLTINPVMSTVHHFLKFYRENFNEDFNSIDIYRNLDFDMNHNAQTNSIMESQAPNFEMLDEVLHSNQDIAIESVTYFNSKQTKRAESILSIFEEKDDEACKIYKNLIANKETEETSSDDDADDITNAMLDNTQKESMNTKKQDDSTDESLIDICIQSKDKINQKIDLTVITGDDNNVSNRIKNRKSKINTRRKMLQYLDTDDDADTDDNYEAKKVPPLKKKKLNKNTNKDKKKLFD
jgi:hypothetical protein